MKQKVKLKSITKISTEQLLTNKESKINILKLKTLILKNSEELFEFKVNYIFFESSNVVDNSKRSFGIKLIKTPNDLRLNDILLLSEAYIEKSCIHDIGFSKDKSIEIYDKIVQNKVTPMCLKDSVSELI